MKKYVKPELFFESYELSQNIASNNCAWDMGYKDNNSMTFNNPNVCVAYGDPAHGMPGVTVFTESNQNCTTVLESYCYENGSGSSGGAIFQS